jgi:hypothetical protein
MAARDSQLLWSRPGRFCGPPEWRLTSGAPPPVGLGWREVAAIPLERAEAASTDWWALAHIAEQCRVVIEGG